MTRLRVPDLLRGADWEHALVLTYSLDLSFYERDLGRTLARVPNRVVLADARRLAEHFDDLARGGAGLHGANVAYAVAALTTARAAHAKVILLAAPGAGLAMVGSGNLTLGGYASQGEQFCVYRYDGTQDQLPPFAAVRQLLDGMAARDWIDEVARSAGRADRRAPRQRGRRARAVLRPGLRRPEPPARPDRPLVCPDTGPGT